MSSCQQAGAVAGMTSIMDFLTHEWTAELGWILLQF